MHFCDKIVKMYAMKIIKKARKYEKWKEKGKKIMFLSEKLHYLCFVIQMLLSNDVVVVTGRIPFTSILSNFLSILLQLPLLLLSLHHFPSFIL